MTGSKDTSNSFRISRRKMGFSITYSGFLSSYALILLALVYGIQGATNLKCYDVQCNGVDCLEVAIATRAVLPTCTATGGNACYIEEEETDSGVFTTAGCGKCSPGSIVDTTDYTTDSNIPKSIDPGLQTTADTSTLTDGGNLGGTSTSPNPFNGMTRKRRSVSDNIVRECCHEDYCNRHNPCGQLTCSAGMPGFTLFSLSIAAVTCWCFV